MVSALVMAVKAFKKNVAKEIAQESGGEYTTFTGDKGFEQRVVDAAKHVPQPLSDHFQPVRSDAWAAYHPRADDAGLRCADRGAGQLLA